MTRRALCSILGPVSRTWSLVRLGVDLRALLVGPDQTFLWNFL